MKPAPRAGGWCKTESVLEVQYMCACVGDMWAAKLTMKERARRRTKEGGETALTNNPYKANIKAREAQNHNKYG